MKRLCKKAAAVSEDDILRLEYSVVYALNNVNGFFEMIEEEKAKDFSNKIEERLQNYKTKEDLEDIYTLLKAMRNGLKYATKIENIIISIEDAMKRVNTLSAGLDKDEKIELE